jgi:pyrroloquinoline quinone (PQQ) biosynthesis protein C
MKTREFLQALRMEVSRHPAVNHLFLNRIATSPFSREDYRVFGENHYPLVCVFTRYLEELLLKGPSSDAKLWLAKVLVDEYGEGSQGADHATLYAGFLAACGSPVAQDPEYRVPEAALRFITTHRTLVAEQPFLVGLGAVGPGHEWAIPRMFESLLIGLRRAGFDEKEIEYFSLHTEQDVDHGRWLEEALLRFGEGDDNQRMIRHGALASLQARDEFWRGVQRAVVRYRQPRAVRPDGATPRSIAQELLLTAWDGVGWARSLENSLLARRAARRPTLAQLIAHGSQ